MPCPTIITISGTPGSGKSTVAKMLAQRLGFHHYSTGDAWRSVAAERGISALDLNILADKDPSIDTQIDDTLRALAKQRDNYVVDTRLGFFFIPRSIKIKLTLDPKIAGERVFHDTQRVQDHNAETIEQAVDAIRKRRAAEVERYQKTYSVDIDNDANFDFIVDTTHRTPDQICDLIVKKFKLK